MNYYKVLAMLISIVLVGVYTGFKLYALVYAYPTYNQCILSNATLTSDGYISANLTTYEGSYGQVDILTFPIKLNATCWFDTTIFGNANSVLFLNPADNAIFPMIFGWIIIAVVAILLIAECNTTSTYLPI
jgi:hypothetical protein